MEANRLTYRLPELAEAARISRTSLHRLIVAGRGPRITRAGRIPLVTLDDAKAWLASLASDASGELR